MNLKDVMVEAAEVLEGITRLQVFSYPPRSVTPPSGYISYPQSINYDETYQRGEDQFTDLPMVLIAGKADEKSARDNVAAWSAGDGFKSVKAHMEAHTWTSCDDLTVTSVEFDVERIGNADYLAAIFKATVVGPGKED